MQENPLQVYIESDYIELQQLLKKLSIVSSGGQAKVYLNNNQVLVDKQLETRRGRKIYPQMLVGVGGKTYIVLKRW